MLNSVHPRRVGFGRKWRLYSRGQKFKTREAEMNNKAYLLLYRLIASETKLVALSDIIHQLVYCNYIFTCFLRRRHDLNSGFARCRLFEYYWRWVKKESLSEVQRAEIVTYTKKAVLSDPLVKD